MAQAITFSDHAVHGPFHPIREMIRAAVGVNPDVDAETGLPFYGPSAADRWTVFNARWTA